MMEHLLEYLARVEQALSRWITPEVFAYQIAAI